MKELTTILNKSKYILFTGFVFLFPLFALPIMRDFIILSKFYLLIYVVLIGLLMSVASLAVTKKIYWTPHPFSQAFILIILSLGLSVILMSPNKIQALYNPHFGLLMFVGFILLNFLLYNYFSSTESKNKNGLVYVLSFSGIVVSLFSIVSSTNVLAKVTLPPAIAFIGNKYFNTFGTSLELIIFQVFVLVMVITSLMKSRTAHQEGHLHKVELNKTYIVIAGLIGLATLLQLYQVIRSLTADGGQFILPPFGTSWVAAVEVLKNPLTAIFGVGVDNFASIFTQAKSLSYNTSPLWQVASFSTSRSTLLHILTETGILGLTAFGILFYRIINSLNKVSFVSKVAMIYAMVMIVLFPPTLVLWFIFFMSLVMFSRDLHSHHNAASYEINLQGLLPIYIAILVVSLLLVLGAGVHASRTFASEIFYKKALDAAQANNLKGLYDYQRSAVLLNPYNEDFRVSFSRTNMILALNVAAKQPETITDTDRQIIAQAIQAAIAEAKAAVALNPTKASSWFYLGSVYRDIINVARGAETWTVTAYQQAIQLDPQNPVYRLNLGGIFYLFQNFDTAQRLFEQTIQLKPDWANAYYNLAWTLYQKKDYANAILAMERTMSYVNPQKEAADYQKAQSDLEEFKKNIPQQTPTPTPGQPETLILPSPPPATIEPKLTLPPQASPEAR